MHIRLNCRTAHAILTNVIGNRSPRVPMPLQTWLVLPSLRSFSPDCGSIYETLSPSIGNLWPDGYVDAPRHWLITRVLRRANV